MFIKQKNSILTLITMGITFGASSLQARIITFFLRPCDVRETPLKIEKFYKNTATPGTYTTKMLKNMTQTNKVNGIFSSYAGYLAVSGMNGQILFPRKTTKESFIILITEKIKPIMMVGATVHHWILDTAVPAHMYSVERIEQPETKTYCWKTKKIALPHNNIIPLNTIIIFAKPKNIIVNEGFVKTTKSPQLYLPDLYVKKTFNLVARSLWVLTMKHFFSPVDFSFKKQSDTYYTKQIPHPFFK